VVHLAGGTDVVVGGSDLELFLRENGGCLFAGPGEIVAIVIESDVGVLTRSSLPNSAYASR
jgi:hypothetical protein